MNRIATRQAALDNALVPPEKRLTIERCNARIAFSKPQREETYQVTLEALKLSLCYLAFLITAEICPILPNQEFIALPSEEEMLLFIKELGYSCKYASLRKQQDLIGSGNHELKSYGSTYEAATSLTEFELKKILLDKIERSESYKTAPEHKELYKGLVKSYNFDKHLFSSYGKAYSLKRDRECEEKDKDPFTGSERGLKKRKMIKDAKPPKGSNSKESKTSSSRGSKSQPKSSSKSMQTEELMFETAGTEMPQDQKGDTKDQPNVKATPMDDWFKKPQRPPTPDPDWNASKSIDFRPTQKWIRRIAQEEKLPFTFIKLEYHFEECYKAAADQLNWNNPKGHEYPFDLSKPLSLIKAQGRQVVPADYFFNNDLEYLKGRSSSRKYTTSTTKTKAAKYDNIEGIEDMVPTL
nr:hypothetical protein [Tanacetum cinerariifolium]